MQYKLVKITDLNGNDKTDNGSLGRIGRIFGMTKEEVVIGKQLFMTCDYPGYEKSVVTSIVTDLIVADDGLIIKTEHSYYYLVEKEIADWYEEQEYQMNVEMASHFDMNGDPIS